MSDGTLISNGRTRVPTKRICQYFILVSGTVEGEFPSSRKLQSVRNLNSRVASSASANGVPAQRILAKARHPGYHRSASLDGRAASLPRASLQDKLS